MGRIAYVSHNWVTYPKSKSKSNFIVNAFQGTDMYAQQYYKQGNNSKKEIKMSNI